MYCTYCFLNTQYNVQHIKEVDVHVHAHCVYNVQCVYNCAMYMYMYRWVKTEENVPNQRNELLQLTSSVVFPSPLRQFLVQRQTPADMHTSPAALHVPVRVKNSGQSSTC